MTGLGLERAAAFVAEHTEKYGKEKVAYAARVRAEAERTCGAHVAAAMASFVARASDGDADEVGPDDVSEGSWKEVDRCSLSII